MANDVCNDANLFTRDRWSLPGTGEWDPDRNVAERIAAMPTYRAHGLTGITVNRQGGSPPGDFRGHRIEGLRERIRRRHPRATEAEMRAGVEGRRLIQRDLAEDPGILPRPGRGDGPQRLKP